MPGTGWFRLIDPGGRSPRVSRQVRSMWLSKSWNSMPWAAAIATMLSSTGAGRNPSRQLCRAVVSRVLLRRS